MRRILILSQAMFLGGSERALLGLLHTLDYRRVSVDLFLNRHEGEFLDRLPSQVHLLPEKKPYTCLAVPAAEVLKKGQLGVALGRFRGKRAAKRFAAERGERCPVVELDYSCKYTLPFLPTISEEEYDLVISFLTPHYFALHKCRGKKKIAWIHTDYSFVTVDVPSEEAMWGGFDHIVSISDAVSDAFVSTFPSLADKLIRIDNILSPAAVRAEAEGDVSGEIDKTTTVLLSCGRFCNAKNFDNVPAIARHLTEHGLDFRWYLIGDGEDRPLVERRIVEEGMEERVILLGKKVNPYPYFAACDLYVQPSRYEGKAVAVREAQILGRPVAITAFATAESQLKNGFDGVILPSDNEGCALGLAALLSDQTRLSLLSEHCLATDYGNEAEAEKLYALME